MTVLASEARDASWIGTPPTSTDPANPALRPDRMPANVDFPEPLSPTMPVNDPAAASKSTSESTVRSPS